jgi:hypothetical protein
MVGWLRFEEYLTRPKKFASGRQVAKCKYPGMQRAEVVMMSTVLGHVLMVSR